MATYLVAEYQDVIDTLPLQDDERESYNLIKTLSANFRVEDASARDLDAPTYSVLKARAGQAKPGANAPAPQLPAPTAAPQLPAALPGAAPAKRSKKGVTAPVGEWDDIRNKFEALFLELLRARAGKGGGGLSSAELEDWLRDRRISLTDLSQDLQDKLSAVATVRLVQYSFPFQPAVKVGKSDQPAAQKILDDLMLGNNCMLIGGAGTGKTYLAQQVARQMLNRETETINCSQWTSPIEIVGGQSLEGYVEGKMVQAYRDGKVLILDEIPKIDPNTAGLLNEALAKTGDKLVVKPNRDELRQQIAAVLGSDVAEAALKQLSSHGSGELFYLFVEQEAFKQNTKQMARYELMLKLFSYPLLQNNRKQFFVKHPYFGVIATGNVYPSGTDMAYGANNKQDLSLLDRFAGSVYYIQKNPALERHVLQNDYVWYICNLLRKVVDENRYEAQVSLRLMQNANRAYEQEVARYTGKQTDGMTANEGKTFAEVIESFILSGFTGTQQQLLKNAVGFDRDIKSLNYRSYGAGGKKFTMPYGV